MAPMDVDKLSDVRDDLMQNFQDVIEANTNELHMAMKNGRLSTVAWLTSGLSLSNR